MTAARAGAASRAGAARVVDAVLTHGMTLDDALAACHDPALPARDRAHLQGLAYDTLRWHLRHRALIRRLLHQPLRPADRILEALLSVGLLQLDDPQRPDHAAVAATVEATRLLGRPRAAGLVNAALRRYQREGAALRAAVAGEVEAHHAHPAWLVERLRHDWPAHWQEILVAHQRHPPLWLRVNRLQDTVAGYAARLQGECALDAAPCADFPDALRLAHPLPVDGLPGFATGAVSVQDAAAQYAAAALDVQPGMRVLDACAAPGGKCAHLLERTGNDIDLTALDIDADRCRTIDATLARLGLRASVIAGDAGTPATWWDGEAFDRILLDAPCSASGVIRRHPDIRFLRRAADIAALAARQRRLLDALWPLLRPGGQLLYVTCSLFEAENSDVVAGFLGAQPEAREVPLAAPTMALRRAGRPGLHFIPGAGDTDGFYYVLMARAAG